MIIVSNITLTIRIVIIVIAVMMTILKIMNKRVKNIHYIIRLNTNNPTEMNTKE
jgi:hypothetical protein